MVFGETVIVAFKVEIVVFKKPVVFVGDGCSVLVVFVNFAVVVFGNVKDPVDMESVLLCAIVLVVL